MLYSDLLSHLGSSDPQSQTKDLLIMRHVEWEERDDGLDKCAFTYKNHKSEAGKCYMWLDACICAQLDCFVWHYLNIWWTIPNIFLDRSQVFYPITHFSVLTRRSLLLSWRWDYYTPAPPPFRDKILRLQPDTVSVSYKRQSCNSLQRQEASNHSAPII